VLRPHLHQLPLSLNCYWWATNFHSFTFTLMIHNYFYLSRVLIDCLNLSGSSRPVLTLPVDGFQLIETESRQDWIIDYPFQILFLSVLIMSRVVFDDTMSSKSHMTDFCKSSFYHLRIISRIRKYLAREATEMVVHAFCTVKWNTWDGGSY